MIGPKFIILLLFAFIAGNLTGFYFGIIDKEVMVLACYYQSVFGISLAGWAARKAR